MPELDANAAFDRLAESILRSHIELNPIEGTWLGIHGANDSDCPNGPWRPPKASWPPCSDHARSLAQFRERDLSIDRVVDLRLARGGHRGADPKASEAPGLARVADRLRR